MTTKQTAPAHEAHFGETKAIADHDHDLVHELSKRIDGVWRYDQYIANAEDKPELVAMWREFKREDQKNAARLKELIRKEIEMGCF
jgi:hypothetical protein